MVTYADFNLVLDAISPLSYQNLYQEKKDELLHTYNTLHVFKGAKKKKHLMNIGIQINLVLKWLLTVSF